MEEAFSKSFHVSACTFAFQLHRVRWHCDDHVNHKVIFDEMRLKSFIYDDYKLVDYNKFCNNQNIKHCLQEF
ncbi:hypothetical protein T4B_6553 [Trichinella pseudospiralis]|uniref:Uncharacterized protein n=1 Tax=Trichinella pseudospiralis TaxID=6337 RepID=A0A0V1K2Q8_TRIPS|nr:hypothetical protein T4A_10754 [Trichinella pseudospiralis]KRZ09135.1 hypothetical protein T4B_6553 [Trichinella pseudospiralis]KRZ41518.1 hypothetical protein T4C_12240 [Trichinella pseudospiralis]